MIKFANKGDFVSRKKGKSKYKVGDKIVDFGQVFRIFKVNDGYVYYRPYYRKSNGNLTFSIPTKRICDTSIRRPVSKKELNSLLDGLSAEDEFEVPSDIKKAKEALGSNNPRIAFEILKCITIEKREESLGYTKSRKDIFELAMGRFIEEVACVFGYSLERAEEKVKTVLDED